MKIAVNKCYGGFSPSKKAYKEYLKLKGKKAFFYKQTKYKSVNNEEEYTRIDDISTKKDSTSWYCHTKDLGKTTKELPDKESIYFDTDEIRIDPDFIKVVETLKDEVNTQVSKIRIIEIPDDVEWEISEYDGIETVEEKHRSW